MINSPPLDVLVQDPLGDVTRKERRLLLGVSVLGVALVKTGLVPSKITALGIEFGKTDQRALMTIFGLVTLYFLVAFVIYGASDFIAWRSAFLQAYQSYFHERRKRQQSDPQAFREDEERVQRYLTFHHPVFALSVPISLLRVIFEFALPVVVGLYAICILWTAKIP